jgi:hypothetical protein
MARLRYLLHPFDKPFGGVATIHRHVEWLTAAGFSSLSVRAMDRASAGSTAPGARTTSITG